MQRMSVATKWRKLPLWLRKNFPAKHPVGVRRVSARALGQYAGDCDLLGTRFLIRINREKSFALKLDTILHEWSHALTWFNETPDEIDPHTAEWGVAYARIYRALWAWNFGRPVDQDEE